MQAMTKRLLIAIAATSLLAACQNRAATPDPASPGDPGVATASMDPEPFQSPPPDPPQTARSALEPQPMKLAEWRGAELKGELGCGFARNVGDLPLLFAASFVDKTATSDAAMKFDGRVVSLKTESKGGFDALSQGARFAGSSGLFANVVKAGKRIAETPHVAEESPRYPALLVVTRGGQELSIDGFWECGP